jgi:hypothetical protein
MIGALGEGGRMLDIDFEQICKTSSMSSSVSSFLGCLRSRNSEVNMTTIRIWMPYAPSTVLRTRERSVLYISSPPIQKISIYSIVGIIHNTKMKSLTTTLLLLPLAYAGLRFPCSTLTFQRLDPAAQPGSFPSAHVHHIVGGNAFNATMEGDVGARATCTTCQMADDFSNYWTATLYFKHPTNGSYHRVTPIPVQPLLGGSDGAKGGLTVYYTQFDLSRDNLKQQSVKAFPPVSCVHHQDLVSTLI